MRPTRLPLSLLYIFAALCLVVAGCGSEQIPFRKAEQAYAIGEYYTAANYYRQSYSRCQRTDNASRAQRAYMMGFCWQRINYVPKSVAAYQNAVRYLDKQEKSLSPEQLRRQLKRERLDTTSRKALRKEEQLEEQRLTQLPAIDSLRWYARFHLARQQLKAGNYKAARQIFELLQRDTPPDEQAERLAPLVANGLRSCQLAADWKARPALHEIKKMPALSSRRSDYSPAFADTEGEQLLFSSTRNDATGDELSGITGVHFADLFMTRKDESGKWQSPETLEGEVNTDYEEGTPAFSPDGKTLYFTRCSSDPDYPRNAEIWRSQRSDASWSKPVKCEISRDTLSSYAHPAVSPDGEWLYFVSDMPGGEGGYDLWRTRILGNDFGGVENLGTPINTPGDEMFPSFRPNGDLFFSSDGHPGMGGLDIFMARDDSLRGWIVENQQYPLNSSADDFGMAFEGLHARGFFSSSRGDARGWDHLFSFYLPEILQTVKGWVYEKDGYELPEAVVQVVGNDGTNENLSVRGDGSFEMELKQGVDYVFLGTCKGYLNVKNELSITPTDESHAYTLQFPLPPINIPVLIDNIFYEFDKATLTPASTEALNKLVEMMAENPHITIELASHCDWRGNDSYNQRLSQRRAESVVNYMIAHGVAADRLSAHGYGESRPKVVRRKLAEQHKFLHEGDTLTEAYIKRLNDEQQEICNALNRRTEFSVLRTTYGLTIEELRSTQPAKQDEEEVEEGENEAEDYVGYREDFE